MNRFKFAATCAFLAAVVGGAMLPGGGVLAAESGGETASFELPADPGEVVVSFREVIDAVRGDDHAWLKIYANGRVVRHRPAWLKRSGDYIGQMPVEQIRELVGSLAAKGVLDFDATAVKSARDRIEGERGELFHASDVSLIEIDVNLASYRPAGAAETQLDFRKQVRWVDIHSDGRRFAELPAIRGLAAAFGELNALAERFEENRRPRQGGGS